MLHKMATFLVVCSSWLYIEQLRQLRKHYFSARTVNIASLPNHAVDVTTVNLFKARIDRFWANQDVKLSNTISRTTWPELEIDKCMKYVIHRFYRAAWNADSV